MFRGFYDTLDTLLAIQKAVDSARNLDLYSNSTTSSGSFPSINLFRKDDDTILTAELPGVKKEDIKLEIKEDLIRISGERRTVYPEKSSVHRVERESMKFDRSLKLPSRVENNQVKADYSDGVLTVTLPRAERDKPKQISIN